MKYSMNLSNCLHSLSNSPNSQTFLYSYIV